jgi:hypothetical protein
MCWRAIFSSAGKHLASTEDVKSKLWGFFHLLGESESVILGKRKLAERLKPGSPYSLDNAPWLLKDSGFLLRR